jgi:hypothetical protein
LVVLDVEDCLLELAVHCIDGLEGVIFEDFLADFVPQVFLGIEFGRIGRQEEQRDIVGHREIAATMIGGAAENQEDILPGKPSRQDMRKL